MKSREVSGQKLISLMAKNESFIGRLYYDYGCKFQNKRFWLELSEHEKEHYNWLKGFFDDKEVLEIEIDGSHSKRNQKIIEESISDVKKLIFVVPETSLNQALENALLIESRLVEKNYFEIFKSTRSSILSIILQLESETYEHINLIENEIKKIPK